MKAEDKLYSRVITCSGYEEEGKYPVLLTEKEFFELWDDSGYFQEFVTKAMEINLAETAALRKHLCAGMKYGGEETQLKHKKEKSQKN